MTWHKACLFAVVSLRLLFMCCRLHPCSLGMSCCGFLVFGRSLSAFVRILLGTVSARAATVQREQFETRASVCSLCAACACPTSVSVVSRQPGIVNPARGRSSFHLRAATSPCLSSLRANQDDSALQCKAELQTSLGDRGVLYLASLQRLSPTAVRLSLCQWEATHRGGQQMPSHRGWISGAAGSTSRKHGASELPANRSMDVAMVDFRGRSADYAQAALVASRKGSLSLLGLIRQ